MTPSYPQTTIELPNFATDSAAGAGARARARLQGVDRGRARTTKPGIGPDDLDCAEVYDLSTAMELDWYEQIGLCAPGEAEKLVRDGETTIGGRIPVNPSGGLACFGEAVPAQAIAQVCELTWQLRGQAGGRQVEGARVGLSINQGLFGHGSAVIVTELTPLDGQPRYGWRRTSSTRSSTIVRSGALSTRARVERRLRVVLDAELDGLREVVAGDARGERQRHVDARRHAGRGDDLALLDHAPAGRDRAVLARAVSSDAQCVVASLPSSSPAAASSIEPVHTDVVHVRRRRRSRGSTRASPRPSRARASRTRRARRARRRSSPRRCE